MSYSASNTMGALFNIARINGRTARRGGVGYVTPVLYEPPADGRQVGLSVCIELCPPITTLPKPEVLALAGYDAVSRQMVCASARCAGHSNGRWRGGFF
jgi:hypothetical protein